MFHTLIFLLNFSLSFLDKTNCIVKISEVIWDDMIQNVHGKKIVFALENLTNLKINRHITRGILMFIIPTLTYSYLLKDYVMVEPPLAL